MSLYPRHIDGLEAMHAKHLDDQLRGRESSIVNHHISLEGSDERSGMLMCAEEGILVMQNIAGGFRAFSSYWRGNTDVSIITGENGSGTGQNQDYQSRGMEHP